MRRLIHLNNEIYDNVNKTQEVIVVKHIIYTFAKITQKEKEYIFMISHKDQINNPRKCCHYNRGKNKP